MDEDIEYPENYKWFSLDEIKTMIRKNNFINMDTRSVIAGINVNNERKISGIFTVQQNSIHSMVEVLSWLTEQKAKYYIQIEKLSLAKLKKWVTTDSQIHHVSNKYFKVVAVNTEIQNREVMQWSQPMIQSVTPGIIAFVVKRMNGIIHFIVQAKIEVGNLDIIELAPTLQCMTGDYRDTRSGDLPFLDLVLEVSKENIIYDTMQSEEGGRFYREENRNLIIQVDEDFETDLPDRYIWMTYNQLHDFMIFNNYLNIQARSLLSAIREYLVKSVNIGILGCSSIAKRSIIPALLSIPEKFTLNGIASQSYVNQNFVFGRKIIDSFNTYSSLIQNNNIDAIYISLPNSMHSNDEKSLDLDLHVLVEKPLATNLTDVKRLNDIALDKNLVLMENFQFRFHKQLSLLKDWTK